MKKLILALTIFLFSFQVISSHLIGGDTRIEQISANKFLVHLRVMTSCPGTSTPTSARNVNIFDKVTNAMVSSHIIIRDSISNFSSPPSVVCFNINYYSDTIILPNNVSGYYLTWRHGPRGGSTPILNYSLGNQIWTCEFPNPAILGGNSNPTFNGNPISTGICVGQNRILDFSSTDPDGDSLVYSLIDPYSNFSITQNKPYQTLAYNSGYNLTNILGLSSTCSINPITGMLSTRATQLGTYIVAVKCEEFRNKNKISETIRDYFLTAINCTPSSINNFSLNNSSIAIFPNPNQGEFNLNINNAQLNSVDVEIYDMFGRIVYQKNLTNKNNRISLSDISAGVYTVKVSSDGQSTTKRIVVN